ncbi:MAG: polymer-forming cytoskeletal protein [Deltaproteobacteria bacterium]|nr:MAG: polymer-forming cytoskeletal protein [Deltaproteobacteria bacterium]
MKRNRNTTNYSLDTFIGSDTIFDGRISSAGSVCVEGSLRGEIEAKGEVVVGYGGKVEADIDANSVTVGGQVVGNIVAHTRFELSATGRVTGDVETTTTSIAEGGLLDGFCRMKPEIEAVDPHLEPLALAGIGPQSDVGSKLELPTPRRKAGRSGPRRLVFYPLTAVFFLVLIAATVGRHYFQERDQMQSSAAEVVPTEQVASLDSALVETSAPPQEEVLVQTEANSDEMALDNSAEFPPAEPEVDQRSVSPSPETTRLLQANYARIESPTVEHTEDGQSFRLNFKLVNPIQGETISGVLAIIAVLKPPHEPHYISFPSMKLDEEGMPIRLRKSLRFRVRFFKYVSGEFDFPFSQAESFRILIYNPGDKPVHEYALLSEEVSPGKTR